MSTNMTICFFLVKYVKTGGKIKCRGHGKSPGGRKMASRDHAPGNFPLPVPGSPRCPIFVPGSLNSKPMLPKGNFPARVYLNGEILPPERANISVFDRGFLFGDAIYEAMVQFQGGIFYKRAHWDRLQKNLEAIAVDFRVQDLDRALQPLLKAS